MIEINLVPDVKQELIKAERVRAVVISTSIVVGIVAIAIVVILSVYVFGVQTVRGVVDDDNIKKGSTQLSGVEDLSKVLTIQNQLTKISALNDEKKLDSRLFDMLLAILPVAENQVQVSGVSIDASTKKISIEGQTSGYDSLEVFKKTINNAVINYKLNKDDKEDQTVALGSEISTSDVSFGENTSGTKVLRFTMTFTYAEELFSPKIDGLTIKISGQGNATDSYIGIPRSIFTDAAKDLESN
ncbi:MAG: hypothetical protein ABIP50_00285 [Candidatus Saccharimonadales bacterium]